MSNNTLFSSEVNHLLTQNFKEVFSTAVNSVIEDYSKPLSRNAAAEFLSINVSTLNRLENNGIIKFHYLGGRKFYLKSELIDAIKKG
jgi:hypothetical protein